MSEARREMTQREFAAMGGRSRRKNPTARVPAGGVALGRFMLVASAGHAVSGRTAQRVRDAALRALEAGADRARVLAALPAAYEITRETSVWCDMWQIARALGWHRSSAHDCGRVRVPVRLSLRADLEPGEVEPRGWSLTATWWRWAKEPEIDAKRWCVRRGALGAAGDWSGPVECVSVRCSIEDAPGALMVELRKGTPLVKGQDVGRGGEWQRTLSRMLIDPPWRGRWLKRMGEKRATRRGKA